MAMMNGPNIPGAILVQGKKVCMLQGFTFNQDVDRVWEKRHEYWQDNKGTWVLWANFSGRFSQKVFSQQVKSTQHSQEGRGELYSREDSKCRKPGNMALERGPWPLGGRGPESLLFDQQSRKQEAVLLMLLPQAIDFATCRAGFVADWQLVLTTRSYSSLHTWRVQQISEVMSAKI